MTADKLKSRHPTLAKAIRSARYWGNGYVKKDGPGTSDTRPFGVYVAAADKANTGSKSGP